MKLNCVVVDDSSIQRMVITKLVSNHTNLNLFDRVLIFENGLIKEDYLVNNLDGKSNYS